MTVARLLRTLASEVQIDGTRFRVGDEPWLDLAELPVPPLADPLCAVLTGHLYNLAHAGGWPDPIRSFDGPPAPPDTAHVAALRATRPPRPPEAGWTLQDSRPDGSARFAKGPWQRTAAPGTWRRVGDGKRLLAHCALDVPTSHPGSSDTFLFLYGSTLGDDATRGGLLRVYLHTRPSGALTVITGLVAALDRLQVPFTLKTLMAPAAVDRTDATVLYVCRRLRRVVLRTVAHLPGLDQLGPQTPLCALRLYPGVAVAEDTGTPESFGMHRMRLLAQGVLESVRAGGDRWEAVQRRFLSAGVRVDAPHLAPGHVTDHREDWP